MDILHERSAFQNTSQDSDAKHTGKKRSAVQVNTSIAESAVNEDMLIIMCRLFVSAVAAAEVSTAKATSTSSDRAARTARRFMMSEFPIWSPGFVEDEKRENSIRHTCVLRSFTQSKSFKIFTWTHPICCKEATKLRYIPCGDMYLVGMSRAIGKTYYHRVSKYVPEVDPSSSMLHPEISLEPGWCRVADYINFPAYPP